MNIGIPKEIKNQEFRVGLSPANVAILTEQGHQVSVETQAGVGAGFDDVAYQQAGANIVDRADAWEQDLMIKVKEPLSSEYDFLRPGQMLFTYLHLAADRKLTEQLLKCETTAIAYETVEQPDGKLPLLAPMSVIAGRLAVQLGARFLEKQQGGRGVLLGGCPGVSPANVMILGGGVVGTEAAKIAVGMGAQVQILDINIERLSYLETLFGSRVQLLFSNSAHIAAGVPGADLLIGAVLLPGRRAPILVSRTLVSKMRPGSVILDVAVDQGGCIETLQVTSYGEPAYETEGVVHVGIPNLPGAVPWTATQALNHSTFPYVLKLANQGVSALEQDVALAKGVNIRQGKIVHPALKQVFPDLSE